MNASGRLPRTQSKPAHRKSEIRGADQRASAQIASPFDPKWPPTHMDDWHRSYAGHRARDPKKLAGAG